LDETNQDIPGVSAEWSPASKRFKTTTHLSSAHSHLPSSPLPQHSFQDTAETVMHGSHLQGACRCCSRFVLG
jgi:hypothetical protein